MDYRDLEIPADREGKSTFLHRLFLATLGLSAINPLFLLPLWALFVVGSGWLWDTLWIPASLVTGVFLVIDGMMLGLLPASGRSWGPVSPPLLALTVVRVGLLWGLALIQPSRELLWTALVLQSLLSISAVYATWIEPFRLGITYQRLQLANWSGPPLTLLHISDLHFERMSPRERTLVQEVKRLAPDLIVLTGDYLNLSSVSDTASQSGAREVLRQFQAPLGVYAVTGSTVVDRPDIVPRVFSDLPIRWLHDEAVEVVWHNQAFWLVGVRCSSEPEHDGEALRAVTAGIPEGAYRLLLYHMPDLMPEVVELGIELYLAGHTHGGQLRLPFFGAIFTASRWGKRYEMGRYEEGETTLYVTRGLGMEGLGAPRARFLSPPEIVLWTIERGDSLSSSGKVW
ncbi:MAG: metallophosphoesterase family protein [Anaerolineae bacterium]|nr:metallophosphoesterase family protein [Anaerolineae bacterium]